jgi:hypothetical protein
MKYSALVPMLTGLGLSVVTSSGFPHHSFASQFDAEKPIRLTGSVTEVEWQNPHAWFYMDVVDDSGNLSNWGMELASPNLLLRNGWTRSSVTIGDDVTVEGFQARDGSNTGNAWSVTLNATGEILSMRPPGTGSEP